ncbi:MAG: hypothetical protein R2762_01110 [Bryobacteraceae bacterium]
MAELLDALICELADALNAIPENAAGAAMRRVLEVLDRSEARIRNDSRARAKYLAGCVERHKFVRFLGMAAAGMGFPRLRWRRFVMPRLLPWREGTEDRSRFPPTEF